MTHPVPAEATSHYRNAMRYNDQPRWFDFYNCRVILPDQGLFFFTMPYILSGPAVPDTDRGLYVYDGGNGGGVPGSQVAMQRIDEGAWSAANAHCELRWERPHGHDSTEAAGNLFSETRIQMTGPTSRWDVQIEPFLTDRDDLESSRRRFEFEERMILNRVPFIHRVPKMKGFATGVIEQQGRRHVFERAIVYQAKNHGFGFPDQWIWVHANTFQENQNLAVEVASLDGPQGPAGMARLATPEGVKILSTWMGDRVEARFDGRKYVLEAESRDGTTTIHGDGVHGENLRIEYAAPNGGRFENNECLLGDLQLDVCGQRHRTACAALGYAGWVGT